MNKKIATLTVTAGLVAGGLGGLALGVPGVTSAATTDTTLADPTVDTTATDAATDPAADAVRPDPGTRLTEVLQPLVDDGTLTQAQLDAVVAKLAEARPFGEGRGGRHMGERGAKLDAVATALGMTTEELATELRAGSTIAEVAAAKGVDIQVVVDAVVAEITANIQEHVADGSITQEAADARLAELSDRVTAMINGERPVRGPGGFGPHADAADDADG